MDAKQVNKVSICKVSETGDKIWLTRLADLYDGTFYEFTPDVTLPKTWENRVRLHANNLIERPSNLEEIGVWEWSATPNANDPEKDYIQTHYLKSIQPIQVISLQNVSDDKTLVEVLSTGVNYRSASDRMIFAYALSSKKGVHYKGVLCSENQLDKVGDLVKPKMEIISLPILQFLPSDILEVSGVSILADINPDLGSNFLVLRSPLEIIRQVFVKKTSWSSLKLAGIKRDDYKKFKSFIEELPQESLYNEIAELCHCSIDEAKKYTSQFIDSVDSYLDGTDIDTTLLLSVLDHSEKLKAECERLVEKEWYLKHYLEIEKALADLDEINKNVKEAQIYYEKETAAAKKTYEEQSLDYISSIEVLEEKKKKLTDDVNGLERLNSDIKSKVQDTITNARKDASEFIKDFAFQYGLPSSGDTEKPKQKEVLNYSIGVELPAEELQENKSWNDEIDTLSEELFTAGVDLNYRYGLAYILYAAFCLKIPLLLAGPSGANIANALSATILGKKAGKLTCTGHYDKGSVDFMKQSDDGIVIISTPFHSEWVENIADIIEDRDKYYIFVCPFVEDLAIEPKGIFNYMLPVATEVFVSHFQEDIFCGGKRSSSFKAYSAVDPRIKYAKQMQMFRMSTLHKNHLQSVLTNAGNMGLDQPDIDYLVAFYAYTVATGKNETFMEILSQDKNKLSKAMNDYLEGIFGEDK